MDPLDAVLKIDEELEAVEDPFISERPPSQIPLVKEFREKRPLPPPAGLDAPLFQILQQRRSGRVYNPVKPLTLQQLSNILFAAAGVTARVDGIYSMLDYPLRATPSAGGLHCVDLYVAAYGVGGLEPGVYYYDYLGHSLGVVCSPCYPHTLSESFTQGEFKNAPLVIFLVGVLKRGLWKYGKAFYRFCHIDAGAVAEHIHLAATAEGLASVLVAGFNRKAVAKSLGLERGEVPILAVVVGHGVRA